MDPDAPQPDVPVTLPETSDTDASVTAPPEPVQQPAPAAEDTVTTPEPLDEAPVIAPTPDSAPANAPPFDPHSADEISFLKNVLGPKSAASLHARTASRLERIMELAKEKGTVDRTAVRLLLRVSATTASSYLTTLYSSGRLTRHHTQHDTVYKVVG